ncbi:MAG: TldD/PmbA family protein [Candidatus Obscuribacter sp.]|nr:TldD/PmbA family protein [Candidatus Obscuribacter sp.]
MFDYLDIALDAAKHYGATYADARLIDQSSELIETKNLTVSVFNRGNSLGIGIRVIAGGGWGFAATQKLNKKAIIECAKTAVEVAKASGTLMQKPLQLAPEPIYNATWVSPHKVDPFSISVETKCALLIDCAKTMLAVKGVTLAQGMLHFIRDDKYFASSEGTRVRQIAIRSGCLIAASASSAQERQRRSYPCSFGQYELAGYEMVQNWDLPGHAQQIAEEAVALLTAANCPQGEIDTIIGSSQLGLQIHESMGHPSELDRALGQEINFAGASFLTPDLRNNLKYGSDIVNLVADATAPGALGSFGFDDEGVAAQCTYLVKDGMFEGYLSSRDTALSIGLPRSGGAMRAESWRFVPIIRMTNISLLPGNAGTLQELIEDTGSGIYMETNKSWSIDSMRFNFQFSTEIAWEFKKVKRTRMLKNPSYSGITPVFWNTCDAICSESDYTYWGTPNCGKGQPMQVMWTGHGASPARFRKLTVGISGSGAKA